ncbi:MAG: TOMM precursor leader peptide-binding protein [Flammeovirgaceae bacterium]
MLRIRDKYALNKVDKYTIISSEEDTVLIQSALTNHLLDIISQQPISRQALLEKYSGTDTYRAVFTTLLQLINSGYITEQKLSFNKAETAYWEELGYDPIRLFERFQQVTIHLTNLGQVNDGLLKETLQATGLQLTADADRADLMIVLVDDYLHPSLKTINQAAIQHKQPWLLMKLNGSVPWLGPLFDPNEATSACWQCLQHRLRLHDKGNQLYQALTASNTPISKPLLRHPLAEQQALSRAVLEIVSWIDQGTNKHLTNGLISVDTKNHEQVHHTVIKRPQCDSCGDQAILLEHPKPVTLSLAGQTLNKQGGYRSVSAEETLNRYQKHISPITGIVPYLKKRLNIPSEHVHNYVSGRNLALQSKSLFWLNMHLRSGNGGKGKTESQAKVGALCESIERYSLMYHEKSYTIQGNIAQIPTAIHPNDCMLFSEQQYANRAISNQGNPKFYSLVPLYLTPDEVIEWTPVYSLSEQRFKHLPTCFCFAQYPASDEANLLAYPDSNGCAAGNTLEEAILQGFLELVERDAAAIWWYNQIERPSVDLSSANNPYLLEVENYYHSIDRSLHVLDITTDFEIPVFVAISQNTKEGESDEVLYAFGSHIEAGIALERAVVELNQLLPLGEKKNGKYASQDPVFIDWLTNVALADLPYLNPKKHEVKHLSDYPKLCEATIGASVQFCIEKAKSLNLETLVLDLTQPDIGLPVARVFVPGLRHFWRRTAPGRLYEVPVNMGWLTQAHTENELNSYSIFI